MPRVTHPEGGRVMVKQSDQGETDINVIVRRARQAGMLPPPQGTPKYGDFTDLGTFHEHVNRVHEAIDQFMLLPARLRQFCGNDVGRFLDLVHTPEGLAQLRELGLDPARTPETATPEETPAAPQEPPATP